jgi:hypothetical protein
MGQPSKEARDRYESKPEVKAARNERQRKRRLEQPEKFKESSRKSERKRKLKKYGLTEEEYTVLLISQNNLCAICCKDKESKRDWHVDHCHTTGKVRGILCHHCNLGLGNFKDNKGYLENAIAYLSK